MSFILKKKFGQNFLIDNNILNKISNLIYSENLNILEIGPGNGKLTDKIIEKKPSKLALVEIDKDLIEDLSEKYKNFEKIEIINQNILDFKISKKYKTIISNLPYNISSPLLVKLTTMDNIPETLILMFQKEFAQRLLDKKLNSLSCLVRSFYNIKFNFNVSKNCFRPIPKVDSTVLTLEKRKNALIKKLEIDEFIVFKRNLFSHKRKSLKNLLKKYYLDDKFNLSMRVENLELEELIRIFRSVNS